MTKDGSFHGRGCSFDVIRFCFLSFLAALAGLEISCSSLQVPMKIPSFEQADMLRAGNYGLELAVKPIEGVHSYWQLFDDNLPEIGIAAAWVALKNSGSGTIDLKRAKWSIDVGGGRTFGRLDNAQVLDMYYKRRHIRMYSVYTDRKAQQNLERISLRTRMLKPSTEVTGLVFFSTDPASAPDWTRRAVLQIRNIRVTGKKPFELTLPLAYAHP
jgi:hypothetical protein